MMSLAYLAAFAVYLFISLVVIAVVVKKAKTPKQRIIWGLLAAFFMYNLVFWDYLPTKWAHQYYCQKETGFWVYKTAEQWRKENPDVVVGSVKPPEGMVLDNRGNGEMLMNDGTILNFFNYRDGNPSLLFRKADGSKGFFLNNTFMYRKTEFRPFQFLTVLIGTEEIIDKLTNEILIRNRIISAGEDNFRIWTRLSLCKIELTVFSQMESFKDMGGE